MNQLSKTQRSVTTVAYDELRWSSVSIKLQSTLTLRLAETKCSLSPVAAVCVHSVGCVEGVGRTENSPIRTDQSYLINTATPRNVWNAYWRNNLANTSSLWLFVLNLLSAVLFVIANMWSNLSTEGTVQMLQVTVHKVLSRCCRWLYIRYCPDAAGNCT